MNLVRDIIFKGQQSASTSPGVICFHSLGHLGVIYKTPLAVLVLAINLEAINKTMKTLPAQRTANSRRKYFSELLFVSLMAFIRSKLPFLCIHVTGFTGDDAAPSVARGHTGPVGRVGF